MFSSICKAIWMVYDKVHKGHIIWPIWYGPFDMDHLIWTIRYEPDNMDHIIMIIWYCKLYGLFVIIKDWLNNFFRISPSDQSKYYNSITRIGFITQLISILVLFWTLSRPPMLSMYRKDLTYRRRNSLCHFFKSMNKNPMIF